MRTFSIWLHMAPILGSLYTTITVSISVEIFFADHLVSKMLVHLFIHVLLPVTENVVVALVAYPSVRIAAHLDSIQVSPNNHVL